MPGFKVNRIAEDLKRELADIFINMIKDPRVSGMVSIVRIDLSGDSSSCKVYVSSIEGIEKTKQAVKGLESATGFVRRELGKRMHMKKTPELKFIADSSIEHSAAIAKMIDNLDLQEEKTVGADNNDEN